MPSSHHLSKLSRYIPLWQRNIPPYPIYQPGDPQIRVFLPLFWMKIIKSKHKAPPNLVTFQVHHQMTRFDIKNYLEKIYDVPVLNVRVAWVREKREDDELKQKGEKAEAEKKIAFVMLEKDEFTYPDVFSKRESQIAETWKQKDSLSRKARIEQSTNVELKDIPPWFR